MNGDISLPASYKGKILNEEQAKELLNQGYFGIDPHCHSSYSYDVPDVPETSPEALVHEEERLGLREFFSDHDTMNGFDYMRKKGLTGSIKTKTGLIPGVEIKIRPLKARHVDLKKDMHTIHINVFGLNKEQFIMLEEISEKYRDLDEFVKYLKQEDLNWMYNHPFWHEPHERLNWKVIPGLAKNYFDVIELNSNRPKAFNDLAMHIAENLNKGIVASTDSHIGKPGRAYVLAEGKNFEQFWENVKERKMYIVRKDMTTLGVVKESAAMIHHIFKANIRTSEERRYTPVTGIKPLDSVALAVTSGRLKKMYFTKKIIHTFFYTLNYTAGPLLAWRLYMSKANNLAERIRESVLFRTKQLIEEDAKVEDSDAHHKRKNAL
jgi:predicted metal-dependent phosphoesterase TrpH